MSLTDTNQTTRVIGVYNLAFSTTSSTNISFASREAGANAPQLVIQTTQSGATNTPTPGPTLTPTNTPAAPTPTPTQPPASSNASFVYDGDGNRVKATINGVTTYFIGAHYEVTGSTVTKYYYAGASRIAMRKYTIPQNPTLTYLLGDHLGSTSLAVDASTGEAIETRYKPWGEVRYTTPNKTLPTQYTFTGQFSYVTDEATDLGSSGFGLMYYGARMYDPALGRFTSADSIVPGGVQGLDRYAYTNNSPINYIDPSGHCPEDDAGCRARLSDTLPGAIPLSPQAHDLIDFAEIVGKTPEEVIEIGIGHEMGGWNAHDLEIAKGHFANRFIEWAGRRCGGDFSSHNCMLNFFMVQFQSVQNMVYESSNYGRANRVHNKYWDEPEHFDRDQNYVDSDTRAPTTSMQAGIDVMNNFWSDVKSRNGDYTHGGFDTGDYLRVDVKDQLGHDPVVGQDGILAIMGITTCQGGAGIAIIVDYQGYITLGSTIGGKHGASVCNVGP